MTTIDQMRIEHADEVLKLQETTKTKYSYDMLRNELEDPSYISLVATNDNEIIGIAIGQVIADELHIHSVAVDENYRRRHIGSDLVKALVQSAQSKGVIRSFLEVRASNSEAISLYASLGFSQNGIRPNYYPNNDEDAIIMNQEYASLS